MICSKKSKMIWTDFLALIDRHQSFLISAHVSPDGDSVGCQLALRWYLLSRGKQAVVYDVDGVPNKLEFLHDSAVIRKEKPAGPFDVFLAIDSSNPDRLGWEGALDAAPRIVNIDHHRDNTHFGHVNLVQTGAATGEILYYFFSENKIDFPPEVAECLYTALLTDTGGFRFSNTNGTILRICADLADRGADCAKIYEHLYATHSPQGMMLLSKIWSTLRYCLDNRVCIMEMPLGLPEELGATYGDSEGVADLTIMVSGVDVGMLIKHTPKQSHFSLRSKDSTDVGEIAKKVPGGGGHSNAAGCTIDLPINEALPKMLALIQESLKAV